MCIGVVVGVAGIDVVVTTGVVVDVVVVVVIVGVSGDKCVIVGGIVADVVLLVVSVLIL